MVAPKDIRASAQSLIAMVILGLGMFVGSIFSGWIQNLFTVEKVTEWQNVFLVPTALTLLCALAFVFVFKARKAADTQAQS
jgi:MFS family permease